MRRCLDDIKQGKYLTLCTKGRGNVRRRIILGKYPGIISRENILHSEIQHDCYVMRRRTADSACGVAGAQSL